ARDKARNSKSSVSWARMGEDERPLSAIGPVPAQFHGMPDRWNTWPDPEAPSAKVAPTKANTRTATETRTRLPSTDCAAERERPRPALMSASPAMASGASSRSGSAMANDRSATGGVEDATINGIPRLPLHGPSCVRDGLVWAPYGRELPRRVPFLQRRYRTQQKRHAYWEPGREGWLRE